MTLLSGIGGAVVGVLALVAIAFILLMTVARYYKKISPNTVAVVTGRNYTEEVDGKKIKRGYRVVVGGGFFLVPIVEKMELMQLNVITVQVAVKNVPDQNGALVTVDAVANIKIRSDSAALPLAIERFLGKEHKEIENTARQTLEGNLRAIVGTLTINDFITDRAGLQKQVIAVASEDLQKLGLGVDVLTVREISDDRKYIESLGKKRTAEVVKDATIGEAEAQRDADIKSAEARQKGEIAKANATQEISDAERERDVQVADNKAKVDAQQARIPLVAQRAAAEEQARVNTAQVDAEKAKVTAEINLQEEEHKRREAELKATIIVKAEKDKEALVISADAKQQAAEREGEATRILQEKKGKGQQAEDTGIAEGRKALAAAHQKELEADAAGEKAKLLANAEGTKAQLLAEAEGILKKAEAFKQLDDAGRLLMVLSALPPVIDAAGNALEKVVKPAAEAIGKGVGNIKELRIIDMGGAGSGRMVGEGKSILSQFSNLPIETLFAIWEKAKAAGLAPALELVAAKLGLDPDAVKAALAKKVEAAKENPPEDGDQV